MLLCWLPPAGRRTGITASAPNPGLGHTPVRQGHTIRHTYTCRRHTLSTLCLILSHTYTHPQICMHSNPLKKTGRLILLSGWIACTQATSFSPHTQVHTHISSLHTAARSLIDTYIYYNAFNITQLYKHITYSIADVYANTYTYSRLDFPSVVKVTWLLPQT